MRGRASVWLWETAGTDTGLVSTATRYQHATWPRRRRRAIPGEWTGVPCSLHEVSASSSFLRFILSLNPSASRRAAAIFACICSPDISDDIVRYGLNGWWGWCGKRNEGQSIGWRCSSVVSMRTFSSTKRPNDWGQHPDE